MIAFLILLALYLAAVLFFVCRAYEHPGRTWRVTHAGWYGPVPIWIAEHEGELCVAIPRSRLLEPLNELWTLVNQGFNWLAALAGFEHFCGFLWWNVREIEPFDYRTR